MIEPPLLETQRLRLLPLDLSDAPEIQKAAGAREIADTMISLPHPYPGGEAARYIARQQGEREAGCVVTFTINRKAGGSFGGLVEVRDIDREHSQGELSFWLAVEFWGRGYMSEVVQAIVRYGFEGLSLNRLYAYNMLRNPPLDVSWKRTASSKRDCCASACGSGGNSRMCRCGLSCNKNGRMPQTSSVPTVKKVQPNRKLATD